MQSKLAMEAASVKTCQLEAELAILREQLAAASCAAIKAPVDGAGTPEVTSAELAAAQKNIAALEDAAVDVRAACARLDREKRALQGQLDAATAGAGTAGGSRGATDSLRRALDAEAERDALQHEADMAKRALDRAALEHSLEVKRVQGGADAAQATATAAQVWPALEHHVWVAQVCWAAQLY
jgi:predicted  nucleic acid-binding Zn-ribbon protein